MINIWTIIKKELTRVFTDKGMIFSLFIIPPLTIYLIYGLMGMSAENQTEKYRTYEATVYVINPPEEISGERGTAKSFLDYLDDFILDEDDEDYEKSLKFRVLQAEENQLNSIRKKVENENADLLIYFTSDFKEKVETKNPDLPPIKLYYNINNSYSKNTYYDFMGKLSEYRMSLTATRVDLEELTVFVELPQELGDEEKAKGSVLSMILPLLLVLYLMAGAMGVGIESIAGEKERGTIATLLVTPIKRSQLAIGKVISISIISVLSSIASFLGLLAVLPQLAKVAENNNEAFGGVSYTLTDYSLLLLIMVTAVLFFVTLIVIVSTYAKSTKQAGTLIMPLYLIVMGTALLNMFNEEISQSLSNYIIPVYNIVISLKALFQFELTFINGLATIISTIVYTLLLIFVIQKMFRSEKIMFNK